MRNIERQLFARRMLSKTGMFSLLLFVCFVLSLSYLRLFTQQFDSTNRKYSTTLFVIEKQKIIVS
jgi:hypothetical protein